MIRVGAVATSIAERLRNNGSRWPSLCLKFVRTCLGVAAKYPSARAAWRAIPAEPRHKGQAPKGYPEWFDIGPFGHVTLSNGDGRSWSNISRDGGVIRLVPRSTFGNYLGWSTHINGVDLPAPAKPKPTSGRTKVTHPSGAWSRKTPDPRGKPVKHRKQGASFQYVAVRKVDGITWLRTVAGNWVRASRTSRGA